MLRLSGIVDRGHSLQGASRRAGPKPRPRRSNAEADGPGRENAGRNKIRPTLDFYAEDAFEAEAHD